MDNYYKTRLYLTSAFIAGILLTLGLKDFYPDLERRFRRGRRRAASKASTGSVSDGIENNNHGKKDIILDDRTDGGSSTCRRWNHDDDDKEEVGIRDVPDGLEACVGNTPLFRIKSLSSETGCEIFAKAEV